MIAELQWIGFEYYSIWAFRVNWEDFLAKKPPTKLRSLCNRNKRQVIAACLGCPGIPPNRAHLLATEQRTYACKIMAPLQSYLQHTSDAKKEAELMEKLCKLDATGEAGIVRFKVRFAGRIRPRD